MNPYMPLESTGNSRRSVLQPPSGTWRPSAYKPTTQPLLGGETLTARCPGAGGPAKVYTSYLLPAASQSESWKAPVIEGPLAVAVGQVCTSTENPGKAVRSTSPAVLSDAETSTK